MQRPLRILLLCVVLSVATSHAALALDPALRLSQYVHDSWTSNDGLPQDSINAIARTPDGYLWFATQEGIARFDGVRFITYDRRNTPGINLTFVYSALVDRSGTLWIGSGGALLRYDGREKFAFVREASDWPATSPKYISEDAAGNLWIGTGTGTATGGYGLIRYNRGKVHVYTTADGLSNDQVNGSCSVGDELWVGTGNGLSILRDGRFRVVTTADGLPDNFVRLVVRDHTGDVWIATPRGLGRYHAGRFTKITTADGLLDDSIYALFEDRHGTLWIGTSKGVNRIVRGKIESGTALPGIGTDTIFSFFEDPEGSLWIGTHSSGLHRLRTGKFVPFGKPEGLGGESVYSIFEDSQGRIWIGTAPDGVTILDGGSTTHLTPRHGLSTGRAKAIMEDRDGSMWIGTVDGLNHLAGGRITSFDMDDGLPDPAVSSIYRDRAGTLWVGTANGLARWNGSRFEGVPLGDEGPENVRILFEDRRGVFWVGGADGLGTFARGAFTPLPEFEDIHLQSVHQDPDGTLWITSWNDGLYRVRNRKVVRFKATDGLYDDVAWSILDDGEGHFWLGSNRGITRVSRRELNDFAEGRIRKISGTVYGAPDGMRRRETNAGFPAALRSRDGRLWFGTTAGVVTIDPKRIRTNTLAPPVVIEKFVADDRVLPANAPVVLEPGTRYIELQFAALSFVAPERVRYRYRLDGFDSHWIEAGSRRSAYYTNVDPGEYTFRVIAANDDGVWNPAGASIAFRLRPFFYQTWWFYALATLALVLLVVAVKELRERQLRIRHQYFHDPVTGLPNRSLLVRRAEAALQEAARANHPVAVLFLDLDGFKVVNDTLGHESGDYMLHLVGRRFHACIRTADTLARIGGDEFAVLATDLSGTSSATEIARRLIDSLREHFVIDGESIRVGVSVGVALFPNDGTDLKSLLKAADQAMYDAKAAGGNVAKFA
ncbi:MAG: two-component regulator propeller domain-containing protein [Thermoanaerobaculia bacterium]